MRSPRKGTIIRPQPDWLAGRAMVAFCSLKNDLAPGGSFWALYNNSNEGDFLWVYDFQTSALFAGGVGLSYFAGQLQSNGNGFGTVQPLVPQTAVGPGLASAGDAVLPVDNYIFLFSTNFSFTPLASRTFPYAIIRPGYSLVQTVFNSNLTQDVASPGLTNFFYVPGPPPKTDGGW